MSSRRRRASARRISPSDNIDPSASNAVLATSLTMDAHGQDLPGRLPELFFPEGSQATRVLDPPGSLLHAWC